MTSDIDDLYENHVLRHFEEPYHRGRLQQPTHSGALRNPVCGDQVQVDLLVDELRRISQAWFEAKGCVISQAAASILCQHVEGQSIDELLAMQPQQMLELLQVPLTATRQQCALLPWKAMQTMLGTAYRPGFHDK